MISERIIPDIFGHDRLVYDITIAETRNMLRNNRATRSALNIRDPYLLHSFILH